MIRFLLNIWNLLEKYTFREILTVSSIVLFFLFINFFATTNLFYSSRGIVKYNELSSEINLNIKELKEIKSNNTELELNIRNIVEFNDFDLLDEVIREYLGYSSDNDHLIIIN
ncbi:MAG: septum formation initiator family protein [Pseudomonadota bacterium]|nr:septum formation initiator family protein [Pseudomonadota bacterium]